MDVFTEILNGNNSPDALLSAVHSTCPVDWYIPLIDHTFGRNWIFNDTRSPTMRDIIKDGVRVNIEINNTFRHGRIHTYNDNLPHAVICYEPPRHAYGYLYLIIKWFKNGKEFRAACISDMPYYFIHTYSYDEEDYGVCHAEDSSNLFPDGITFKEMIKYIKQKHNNLHNLLDGLE